MNSVRMFFPVLPRKHAIFFIFIILFYFYALQKP